MSLGSWTSSLTVLAVSDSLGTRKVSALNEPEAVLSVCTVTWAPAVAGSRASPAAPRAAARALRFSQRAAGRQRRSHESFSLRWCKQDRVTRGACQQQTVLRVGKA